VIIEYLYENKKMPKKVFITFGTQQYARSLNRIVKEAESINYFTDIHAFTDADLKSDTDFWSKHGCFIESNHRGYGFWLWKPYLIQKVLKTLESDDILVYADAGCEINIHGRPRLLEYEEMVRSSDYGMISFQLEFKEKQYTKRFVLRALGGDKEALQCVGGIQFMRKTEHSEKIVNMWYSTACMYIFINDIHSSPEEPEFIDHRHDQSVYSVIVNKYGSIKLKDETYFGPNWENGKNFPILAKRYR
jgi:hypothetical protein